MKTKRFQECKVDAVPIEKIAARASPSKKRGVLQVFKFYVRSSRKIKESEFRGKKNCKRRHLVFCRCSFNRKKRRGNPRLADPASSSHSRVRK